MRQSTTRFLIDIAVLLLVTSCCRQVIAATALPDNNHRIEILPTDGGNLVFDEYFPPDRVTVYLSSQVHNWFAGTFTQLPTEGKLTIGFSLGDNENKDRTEQNPADVRKWQGLRPVMTYADTTQYASYEWFKRREDGMWVSGDPFKRGADRLAGHERFPMQQAIPEALAEYCLSADGTYWCPWQDVDAAQAIPATNIFRVTHAFKSPTATVAMRTPFTYTFLQAAVARLEAARLPGVFVDVLGTTPGQRKLYVIRVEDPDQPGPSLEKRTILLIAREHATEHASSWAAWGALSALIADTPEATQLRRGFTWLILPIEDPDGSASSTFDKLTGLFFCQQDTVSPTSVVYAYAKYISDYIYAGQSIDMAVSLHNIEANEAENLICPYVNVAYESPAMGINKKVFSAATQEGFRTGSPDHPWVFGSCPNRLFGWCAGQYGSLDLAFEVNDRYPEHPLSLMQLQLLGRTIATALASWSQSTEGANWHRHVCKLQDIKVFERGIYYRKVGRNADTRSIYDLLSRGF